MKPLEGIRILTVEHVGAGPYGTMFLAGLGAEVIKIENAATGGDVGRHTGPRFLGEPLHLTVRKPNWWFAQLTLAGFKISAHAMANDKDGEAAQLHVFLTV